MFFFFKQKSAFELRISDLISDVCSSDLIAPAHWLRAKLGGDGASARHIDALQVLSARPGTSGSDQAFLWFAMHMAFDELGDHDRSEERRVGKECVSTCRLRWSK